MYPPSHENSATGQEQQPQAPQQPAAPILEPVANPPTPVPNPVSPNHRPATPVSMGGRHDAIEKAEQITTFTYFGIAALLMFRFALSLFGASRTTPFVDFVFQLTTPFMIPFDAMFGGPRGVADYQLEFEVLVAILVYGLIFFGIARLIRIIFR